MGLFQLLWLRTSCPMPNTDIRRCVTTSRATHGVVRQGVSRLVKKVERRGLRGPFGIRCQKVCVLCCNVGPSQYPPPTLQPAEPGMGAGLAAQDAAPLAGSGRAVGA